MLQISGRENFRWLPQKNSVEVALISLKSLETTQKPLKPPVEAS